MKHTLIALKEAVGNNYVIRQIEPKEVISTNWEKETVLFVMPGGADLPYCNNLNGLGNIKIAEYIRNGGSYLGICAGAYYAGSHVEFAVETEMEVTGKRELAFFPGIVRGPVLAPYEYTTNKGARAATISWNADNFDGNLYAIYFNGGGYFVDADMYPNIVVLATYIRNRENDLGGLTWINQSILSNKLLPAIVECSYGLGKAILSGVHIEYSPDLLDSNDNFYKEIIPILSEGNNSRQILFKHILERLIL